MIDTRVFERVAQQQQQNDSRFTNPSEIDRAERDTYREAAQKKQNQPQIINLSSHIRKAWIRNRTAKMPFEEQGLQNLIQCKGEYDSNALSRITAQGGSKVFLNITSIKCRAPEAWLEDTMLPAGERPYSIEPTPIPDIADGLDNEIATRMQAEYMDVIANAINNGKMTPDQIPEMISRMKDDVLKSVKEMAEKDAKSFEDEIDDELVEGGWYEALRKVIPDLVRLPAGIIHGPEVHRKKVLEWSQYPDGTPYANVTQKPLRMYRRVNFFDLYPSPGATNCDDGDLIERIRLTRSDLLGYLSLPPEYGFDDNAIRLVLEQYGLGGLREWLVNDLQRQEAENRGTYGTYSEDEKIDCLKFMGRVQGAMLLQWGMSPEQVEDPLMDYEVTAYLIGQYVIKAKLNDDPLDKRNYHVTSFEKSNDSVWGRGVPQLMADIQKICNGCARALVNNMSHASGPQLWMYDNLVNGIIPNGIRPWQILHMKTDPSQPNSRAPVGYFQPNLIADQLLKVFEFFFKLASEVTGVPAYIYGSDSNNKGATDTASGLSMMMNAAAKGLKAVAGHTDNDIIKPSIKAHWMHIMLNEPKRAKGDINIVARASEYLLLQEQLQIRRAEFLERTRNPIDMQIIGMEGRSEVLRETAKGLKMQTDKIVPDRNSIIEMKQASEMDAMVQKISAAVGLPVEQVQAIIAGEVQGQTKGGNHQALGPDGAPVAGQDQGRLMQ
jgi:hypothetical protein